MLWYKTTLMLKSTILCAILALLLAFICLTICDIKYYNIYNSFRDFVIVGLLQNHENALFRDFSSNLAFVC